MKYRIMIISLLAIIMVCCAATKPRKYNERSYRTGELTISVFEIEGCEYVSASKHMGAGITHKGNCKYCNKE